MSKAHSNVNPQWDMESKNKKVRIWQLFTVTKEDIKKIQERVDPNYMKHISGNKWINAIYSDYVLRPLECAINGYQIDNLFQLYLSSAWVSCTHV